MRCIEIELTNKFSYIQKSIIVGIDYYLNNTICLKIVLYRCLFWHKTQNLRVLCDYNLVT